MTRYISVRSIWAWATLGLCACSGGATATSSTPTTDSTPATLNVPAQYSSIQKAVDSAKSGDLILIAPGTYTESVTVETPGIVLRGADRNDVIIKGDGSAENGIFVLSDRVAVENLTIRDFRSNGLLFAGSYDDDHPLKGYRASYITVHNNGLYGVYAFAATSGEIDHIYASGHPDGGVYVGQCQPCDTVVTDVLAENNSVGFMGTNSGGNLFVINSRFVHNRVGVQPNASKKEELYPGSELAVVGNVIADNNNPKTPKATEAFGVGVGIGGALDTLVQHNLITGNDAAGVVVADNESFVPSGSVISDNSLSANGTDLMVSSASATNLCFERNAFASSAPANIERAWQCGSAGSGGSVPYVQAASPPDFPGSKLPDPPRQDSMPDALNAPAKPALTTVAFPDLSTIATPATKDGS